MEEEEKIKKAVALRYDRSEESAPRVVASGKGYQARMILAVAGEADVPVYEDPTLVEMLSCLEPGAEIPAELYQMVAEILVFVYSLDKKARKHTNLSMISQP